VLLPCVAVIVANTLLVTPVVVIVNVAEVVPGATETDAGNIAVALLEVKFISVPPEGAGPFNVNVPVEEVPPTTTEGDNVRLVNAAGVTVSVVVTDELPRVAVIVAGVEDATAVVVTVNVAVVAPPATVTVTGGVALVLLDDRLTTEPPVGAACFKVTVPEEEVPPMTVVGETVTLVKVTGVTVSVVVTVELPNVAVMVTGIVEVTGVVLIVKLAELAPAATLTVADIVAFVLLEDKLTSVPPVGDGDCKVTVPVDDVPPITVVGDTVTLASITGEMVRLAVTDALPKLAVIVADVELVTAVVVTVKVAVVAPAPMVTDAGTVAFALLDDSLMTEPPVGAGTERVTVPVEGVPPRTVVGDSVTLDKASAVTVSVALSETPPRLAEMATDVFVGTTDVPIVKVASVCPAAIVTVDGTEAALLLLEMAIVSPPAGAGPFSETVPVADEPPATDVGLTVSVVSPMGAVPSL